MYRGKQVLDLALSVSILLVFSPILLAAVLIVWLYDFRFPFYLARRVSRGGGEFQMYKIRSMSVGADKTGVSSTQKGDSRITPIGKIIRKYKLDELSQFVNVVIGNMSIVGPRPNTRAHGVDLYTSVEQNLLSVKPGITDLASIVFSDEGEILEGAVDADAAYNRIIRPWKSRLGLFYIQHASLQMDIAIVWLTAMAILDKSKALKGICRLLERHGADQTLINVCRRDSAIPLVAPP